VVGIVLVSHVAAVADGAAELAREMGGKDVRIEPAGGLEDGAVGTDAERVRAAIERAMSPDGVLVLMDLGSALMSAEMATELLGGESRVLLSEAALVEGAVAAAAAARGGATLPQVAAEARGALAMKESQLAGEQRAAPEGGPASAPEAPPAAVAPQAPEAEARAAVLNEIGLHARPAARVVELAARFDADLRLAKAGGPGPVSARSLTGLMTLAARLGDELIATASGPQAAEAVGAFERLAGEGFGEGISGGAAVSEPARGEDRVTVPATAEAGVALAPPAAGSRLVGVAVSPGLALAPAHRLDLEAAGLPERAAEAAESERRRLDEARAAAREAIAADRERVESGGAAAEATIFDAHLALLEDEALLEPARASIERGATAERAWEEAARGAAATYRQLDDPLLRERAADVEDVGRRVIAAISGQEPTAGPADEAVVVAPELTPAAVAALDHKLVRGLATARGTPTAHASILARALGLPAVVGLGEELLGVPSGQMLFLDGESGVVEVDPPDAELQEARGRIERAAARQATARRAARQPAITRDGTRIEVAANLGGAAEVQRVVEMGADGVGLLRTEFLFLDRSSLPSEDEQARTLEEIGRGLAGRPLIVRTLDAGADKPLPGLATEREDNPFLGRRGIRLSLAEPDLFDAQLRAILRVAARHPLKVMFPMVSGLGEVEAASAALQRARADTGIDEPLEVGIMVEVPAAALLAERLAPLIDFFSIGTNDLAQYTMAAERGNERVAPLLAGPHPAVLRLVRETAAAAEAHDRWVGVCGELAGDPAAALLLVGLGVRELSVAPALIPAVKAALREVTIDDASAAARWALAASSAEEARQAGAALL
jgi:multiphosphoryl transfer protein